MKVAELISTCNNMIARNLILKQSNNGIEVFDRLLSLTKCMVPLKNNDIVVCFDIENYIPSFRIFLNNQELKCLSNFELLKLLSSEIDDDKLKETISKGITLEETAAKLIVDITSLLGKGYSEINQSEHHYLTIDDILKEMDCDF